LTRTAVKRQLVGCGVYVFLTSHCCVVSPTWGTSCSERRLMYRGGQSLTAVLELEVKHAAASPAVVARRTLSLAVCKQISRSAYWLVVLGKVANSGVPPRPAQMAYIRRTSSPPYPSMFQQLVSTRRQGNWC